MNARYLAGAATLVLVAVLTACGPASDGSGEAGASSDPSAPASESPGGTAEPSPSPSPSPTSTAVALPTDCRAILSEDVLAQLEGIPLNDAAFGPSGVGDDGSLTCIWADPGADTTGLTTTISGMNDGRTLFWRDDILIDTRYSNLAPDGYTSSIVENLFG